jgi:hypothetical protein
MSMQKRLMVCLAAGAMAAGVSAVAQESGIPTRTTVTVETKGNGPASLQKQDVQVKLGGKNSPVTGLAALNGDRAGLQLVILIDDSARTSLGSQVPDLKHFVMGLPPTTSVGIAYMRNGTAAFSQGLTSDHALAANGLRLPAGSAGGNASPFFCLQDLLKRWPNAQGGVRREVLMITDGVDPYAVRFDPDNPYITTTMSQAQKVGVVVYSIYWRDRGQLDASGYENNTGQSYLQLVSQATGGKAYWQGVGNPVSLSPFLDDLARKLNNQFELSFVARPQAKAGLQELKVKTEAPGTRLDAPERVLVDPTANAPGTAPL